MQAPIECGIIGRRRRRGPHQHIDPQVVGVNPHKGTLLTRPIGQKSALPRMRRWDDWHRMPVVVVLGCHERGVLEYLQADDSAPKHKE